MEQWLKKEYPRIRALAKRERAEICFEDESGIRSDFHSGSTWTVCGRTPIARAFIQFLERLLQGRRRPVFLIVDGHPAHRSKPVKAYVEGLAGRLRLFFLPPYSPGLNLDEPVWNEVKNDAVGRSRHDGPDDLHRVPSVFQAPETRYAA